MKNNWKFGILMILAMSFMAHGADYEYLRPGGLCAAGTVTNVTSGKNGGFDVEVRNIKVFAANQVKKPKNMMLHLEYGMTGSILLGIGEDAKDWIGKTAVFSAVRNNDIYDVLNYHAADMGPVPDPFTVLNADEQYIVDSLERIAPVLVLTNHREKTDESLKVIESSAEPMFLKEYLLRVMYPAMGEDAEIKNILIEKLKKLKENVQFPPKLLLSIDGSLVSIMKNKYSYSEERQKFLKSLLEYQNISGGDRRFILDQLAQIEKGDPFNDLTQFGGPYNGFLGKAIWFNGIPLKDPDLELTYTWDFGDGSSGTEESPHHIYKAVGTYTVSRTAYGGKDGPSTGTTTVEITMPPPPVITARIEPSPNEKGWNNSDVTVIFPCRDSNVGIASVPVPIVVTTEGANQVMEGMTINRAGLSATAIITVNLDKTPPVISRLTLPETISSGKNGVVTVEATDNYGIDKVVVSANQTMIQTLTSAPYTTTITAPSTTTPGDKLAITVQVIDLAGNIKTATGTIQVTAK
jgi:PKD repeat protein